MAAKMLPNASGDRSESPEEVTPGGEGLTPHATSDEREDVVVTPLESNVEPLPLITVEEEAVRPAGPKACLGCGSIRTPQWREGPLGPKTLCNACGVRRYRERNQGEKNKPAKAWKAAAAAVAEAEDADGTPEPGADGDGLNGHASSRHKRKAAERAMQRTHTYAEKGEWDWNEGSPSSSKRPSSKRSKLGDVPDGRMRGLDKADEKRHDGKGSTTSHTSTHSVTEEVEWATSSRYNTTMPPSTLRQACRLGGGATHNNPTHLARRDSGAARLAASTPPHEPQSPTEEAMPPYSGCTVDQTAAVQLMCISEDRKNHPYRLNYERKLELSRAKSKNLVARCQGLMSDGNLDVDAATKADLRARVESYQLATQELSEAERIANEMARSFALQLRKVEEARRQVTSLEDCLSTFAKYHSSK